MVIPVFPPPSKRRRLLQMAATAPFWPADVRAAGELRAGSFNLRFDTPQDGLDAWPLRRAAVLALIRRHHFDLLGTQEGLLHQVEAIEGLGEFGRVGVGRDDGRAAGEFAALFYRLSRFELLAQGDFWLSETPDRPSRGWDARCCPRVVSWARLRDRSDGRCWRVASVHFDHQGRVAQIESARLLLRWLQREAGDELQLLLGDFNLAPERAAAAMLRERLHDAHAISESPPQGPAGSFHAFGRQLPAPASARIDHVYVDRRVRVLSHRLIDDQQDGRYPSDHFPVLVRLLPT
jgi:endonuclease/exonuclease/phosphatase family metal-dependent hydrolase